MAQPIKMPALGESVTEGTVTQWLKQVGDHISEDEPIVEVATDKVDSEVPSPVSGVLLEILVPEDETVAVGTEIAIVGSADESSSVPKSQPASENVAPVPVPEPTIEEPFTVQSGDLTEIEMPALGESVTEGTVTQWLKQVGDHINEDEPIVEVATDKVDSEVPSPVSGVLAEIRANEDETVAVGEVIAVVAPEGSTAPATTKTPEPANAASAPATPPAPPTPPTPPAPPAPPAAPSWANAPKANPQDTQAIVDDLATKAAEKGRLVAPKPSDSAAAKYVTPLVRKFARENNVNLSEVEGTGVGGRIRKEDVTAFLERKRSEHKPVATPMKTEDSRRGTTQKMTRLRQTIARRMVESLQTAAQLTTVIEVDVTNVVKLRAENKDRFAEQWDTKLTFLPFFVKAAADALKEHPVINATINDKDVKYFDYENIGIAVDAPKGLVVPVIKDAGQLNIAEISKEINSLAKKVREGSISPDDLTGSTFTITNTGSGGALFDTPVLNLPEVAILGVGTIVKRAVVVKDSGGGDAIAVRSMVYLSLSYDHRLVDGADAARYLQTVKKRLESADFNADLAI